MSLSNRLIIMFALVAIFATGTTSYLSHQATINQVRRYVNREVGSRGQNTHSPGPKQRAELLDNLKKSAIQAAAIALLVAVIAASYFAYSLTKPIKNLSKVTDAYALGERSARAKVGNNDNFELNRLAKSFNNMADKISEEEENKRRMAADIAHELRTPLAIFKAELEALEDGLLEPSPEVYRGLVEEVNFLEHLVNDLRLLSLAESGELRLSLTNLDLSELVKDQLGKLKTKKKNITVVTDLSKCEIYADPDRIKQIVVNLLTNAVRYSKDNSEIQVKTFNQNGLPTLTIDNESEQALPDKPDRLFERFYRSDSARNRSSGGMGLGLAIAKVLANLHKAELRLFNHETKVRAELIFEQANTQT